MKRLPLTENHLARLAEYGLQNVPRAACACLLFAPGETVLREGETILWYSVVIGGRAKVCRAGPNGRTLTLCTYDAEGMIGEIELLTNRETATTSVTAVTDFECVAIPYQDCRVELVRNVVFLHKLGAALAEKLVQSADNLSASALCSGEQRLCAYILQAANKGVFCDVLTDVSSAIGMSYRHLFRLLRELCAQGVLEKGKSGYRILNKAALALRASDTAATGSVDTN